MLAHGIGGRQDLPIPFSYVVIGAALALVASFAVLGLFWRTPQLRPDLRQASPLPAPIRRAAASRGWARCRRAVGLVLASYLLVALLLGPDSERNPAAGMVFVLFWLGLAPLSLLFGPAWRGLNPLRTLHLAGSRLARRDPAAGLRPLPQGWGYTPAAAGLFAFVWLELVAPGRATLPVIGLWLAVYAAAMLAGAVVFGAGWFDRGDAFEVYSDLVGRLASVGRRPDGTLVRQNPLDGMAGLRAAPGLPLLVTVLLGATMYDSLSNAPGWVRLTQESGLPAPLTGTLGLAGVIALVHGAYMLATGLAADPAPTPDPAPAGSPPAAARSAPGAVRTLRRAAKKAPRFVPATRARLRGELAHSIVPIALGYLAAHYLTLFLLEGQHTLILLSDPLVTGANWLGTRDASVSALGMSPSSVAVLQVTLIVTGHLVGAVLAHDRTLTLVTPARALKAQLPLLLLMTLYTTLGLLLLFT